MPRCRECGECWGRRRRASSAASQPLWPPCRRGGRGGPAGRLLSSQASAASLLMIAAVLATLASPQVRAATLTVRQHGAGRLAGPRIDDVMHRRAPRRPRPDGGARGRQAARADGHGLARRIGRRGVIVGDPDLPAVAGRRPGDGDIPAETDQDTATQSPGDQGSAVIGGPCLGGGAEIELGAARPAGRLAGEDRAGQRASRAPDRAGTAAVAVPSRSSAKSRS